MRKSPPMSMPLAAAVMTLVGVPAGLALTGGTVQLSFTAPLAVTLAALVLLVRRWPLAVLIASILIMIGLRTSNLVTAGWVWPATAALVALVLAGRSRAAVVTASAGLLYGFGWDYFANFRVTHNWAIAHVFGEALVVAVVLAVATTFHTNRVWRELDASRRLAEERVGIARDLHDVVAHTLAVVGVHLNVALDAFDSNPGEAKESIRLAQEVRGRAMTDLRALVHVLRDGAEVAPTGSLGELDTVIAQVRDAGLTVEVLETGDRSAVPAPVSTAAFRVVQEALTNTVRHAGATTADVVVRCDDLEVSIEVIDNGQGGAVGSEGHGIAGMRERVVALGGSLTAGGTPAGFRVRATIPMSGR